MPDFSLEFEAGGIVAGLDEAGRGPLAGPVVAAAVILDWKRTPRWLRTGIDDSKVLAPARRRELCAGLYACARIGVGAASVFEIESTNILLATFLAMRRALLRLDTRPDLALVDGPLVPALPCPARPVVGGDGLSLSIAAASIVAKVTRDRIMAALAPRYPGYGWETNVGYGTLAHRSALAQLGITRHHRRTFSPIDNMLSPTAPATADVGCEVSR